MGSPVPKPEQLVAQHQFHRDAGDIDAHAGGQGFADEEEAAGGLAGRGAEGVGEQLVGRVDLALEVVGDQDDGQDDAGDDVADDHLDEGDVAAVGHRGHADDGQRAGFGGDDGQADAPPGDVLAAEEVVAGVVLVFAEPQPERDNAEQIDEDDGPIARAEVAVHRFVHVEISIALN